MEKETIKKEIENAEKNIHDSIVNNNSVEARDSLTLRSISYSLLVIAKMLFVEKYDNEK